MYLRHHSVDNQHGQKPAAISTDAAQLVQIGHIREKGSRLLHILISRRKDRKKKRKEKEKEKEKERKTKTRESIISIVCEMHAKVQI